MLDLRGPRAHEDLVNRLLHIAVFIGVLFQALIPLGFMPGANAATPVVICSGMDMKIVYVDEDGQPAHQQDQSQKSCAFAAIAFGLTADPVVVTAPAHYAAEIPAVSISLVLPFAAHTHPWQTGPPAFLI